MRNVLAKVGPLVPQLDGTRKRIGVVDDTPKVSELDSHWKDTRCRLNVFRNYWFPDPSAVPRYIFSFYRVDHVLNTVHVAVCSANDIASKQKIS